MLGLLAELVLQPQGGHQATVQCLGIWQDLQQAELSLSVVLDELRASTSTSEVLASGLRLVNRLLACAPDPVARIRVRHELEREFAPLSTNLPAGLHFRDALDQLSTR